MSLRAYQCIRTRLIPPIRVCCLLCWHNALRRVLFLDSSRATGESILKNPDFSPRNVLGLVVLVELDG